MEFGCKVYYMYFDVIMKQQFKVVVGLNGGFYCDFYYQISVEVGFGEEKLF